MFLALLRRTRASAGSCWTCERGSDLTCEKMIQNGSRWIPDRLIDFTMIPREYIDIDGPVLDYTDQAQVPEIPIFTSRVNGDRSNTTTSRDDLLDGRRSTES
jgi:hypothetical protein